MASREIITNIFRASYVHLKEKYAHNQGDVPKYRLSMMFPKTNVVPAHISTANVPASCATIIQALDEVCMQEFGTNFNDTVHQYQIQFPPRWKDGDTDFKKDEQGRLTAEVNESSAGMWIMNVTSDDAVGCVDHTGTNEIDVGQIYSGCWAAAELEISAYRNKSNNAIVSVKLCNVQKCYDDASLGGGRAPRSASAAFAGHAVADSNCQVGAGQQFGNQAAPAPAPQQAAPQAPGAPVAAPQQAAPQVPVQQQAAPAPQQAAPAAAPQAPMGAPQAPMAAPQAPAPQQAAPAPQQAAPAAPQQPGQTYMTPPAMPGQ